MQKMTVEKRSSLVGKRSMKGQQPQQQEEEEEKEEEEEVKEKKHEQSLESSFVDEVDFQSSGNMELNVAVESQHDGSCSTSKEPLDHRTSTYAIGSTYEFVAVEVLTPFGFHLKVTWRLH